MRHLLAAFLLVASGLPAAAFDCSPHRVVFVEERSGRIFTSTAYGAGSKIVRHSRTARVTSVHVWEGRIGDRPAYLSLERVADREGYARGAYERPALDADLSWAPRRDVMRWVGEGASGGPQPAVVAVARGPLQGVWQARHCAA